VQTGDYYITATTYEGTEVMITSSSELFDDLASVIMQEQTDLDTDLTAQDGVKSFPDNPYDLV